MPRTDVAILGGGLAGLSLALQLQQRGLEADITVVDRAERPLRERSSTVGESFAEVGAHYLREVIGLHDHLDAEELPKFGLRFFVGDDYDLEQRYEIGFLNPAPAGPINGHMTGLPLRTHQVDRARLENELADRCQAAGVTILGGRNIADVKVDARGHVIDVHGDGTERIEARWVVFAGGPGMAGIPAHRQSLDHRISASWVRVEGELDVGSWSASPSFKDQTLPGWRRLSTNHFTGAGYWIWLIPLPSGATSVGVVVDPETVPDFAPRDFVELLAWLKPRDRRLHDELLNATPIEGDFHHVDVDAHMVDQCFHADRWAVVGAAASLIDVLYSPGADLIAVGNSLTADLVAADLGGASNEHMAIECERANRLFGAFARGFADLYRGQYRHFDKPGLVTTKAVWDSALYFAFNTLLYRHDMFGDPALMSQIRPELVALGRMQKRVQKRFRDGDLNPLFAPDASPVDWGTVEGMTDNYYGAESQPDRAAVLHQLREGVATLTTMAARIEGAA